MAGSQSSSFCRVCFEEMNQDLCTPFYHRRLMQRASNRGVKRCPSTDCMRQTTTDELPVDFCLRPFYKRLCQNQSLSTTRSHFENIVCQRLRFLLPSHDPPRALFSVSVSVAFFRSSCGGERLRCCCMHESLHGNLLINT